MYVLFPDLKKKYDDAESACQLLKHDLESAKEDLCQVKEDLKWYVHRIRIVLAFVLQSYSLKESVFFNSGRLGFIQASFKFLTMIYTRRFKK